MFILLAPSDSTRHVSVQVKPRSRKLKDKNERVSSECRCLLAEVTECVAGCSDERAFKTTDFKKLIQEEHLKPNVSEIIQPRKTHPDC